MTECWIVAISYLDFEGDWREHKIECESKAMAQDVVFGIFQDGLRYERDMMEGMDRAFMVTFIFPPHRILGANICKKP